MGQAAKRLNMSRSNVSRSGKRAGVRQEMGARVGIVEVKSIEMKWAVSLICCLTFCLNGAAAAELTGARTVYLMPMGRGGGHHLHRLPKWRNLRNIAPRPSRPVGGAVVHYDDLIDKIMLRSTRLMPCSSFRQGMMTVIVSPLYIGFMHHVGDDFEIAAEIAQAGNL
jgi:hypothetical protein